MSSRGAVCPLLSLGSRDVHITIDIPLLRYTRKKKKNQLRLFGLWGGGQGGLNLPLPVPFNPGSRPVFFGSRPFAVFRLRNIAQCCVIFPFFSRFPPPWESRFPPPLLPPPVHLPPPFLLVSRPPVPPPPHWFGC